MIPRFPLPADPPEPLYQSEDAARDWSLTLEPALWSDGDDGPPEPVASLTVEDMAGEACRLLLDPAQARELGEALVAWAAEHQRTRAQA